ncbi:hypothetical protein AM1BK_15860 [Neobacillus kokaensis]|uniref:Uncharacterized protein n=1 Tax=Neobacillus kokaensis TaxID=2759023 RepID=A0ABQ3N3D8_9BACI|nr:hypothetical protein AM1BK_15860 [Neobacillus kokaensis]
MYRIAVRLGRGKGFTPLPLYAYKEATVMNGFLLENVKAGNSVGYKNKIVKAL